MSVINYNNAPEEFQQQNTGQANFRKNDNKIQMFIKLIKDDGMGVNWRS